MSYLQSISGRSTLHRPFSARLDAWSAWLSRRREQAKLVELASLDPRLLDDIGLLSTGQKREIPMMLDLHPAAVARRAMTQISSLTARRADDFDKQPEG